MSSFIYYKWNLPIFGNGLIVRGIFVDVSKAFDEVYYKDLIFKLKQKGVRGDLLNASTDFLKERKQRVVLDGQKSNWSNISIVAPQS